MANITHYRIKDYDSLESIASTYLGDPDRWIDIVTVNNLRWPFISDDPKYQYGVILESGSLGSTLLPGSNLVTLSLTSLQLVAPKGILLIEQTGTNGQVTREALIVANSVDTSTINGVITINFTKSTVNSFDSTATWYIFSNPALQTTKVAKVGDVLVLVGSLTNDPVDTTEQFNRLLGTDMELDESAHQLHWDSTTHDFKTVGGIDNLKQAMRMKIMTNQGDLVYHPNYGDRLLQFIGAANTPQLLSFAPGHIRQCLLQDPRLFSVENITATARGDILSVDLKARVRGIDTLVEVNSLGIGLN